MNIKLYQGQYASSNHKITCKICGIYVCVSRYVVTFVNVMNLNYLYLILGYVENFVSSISCWHLDVGHYHVTLYIQKPNVIALKPTSGPRSGGTIITLRGSHLGIGNRNVRVHIGNTDCTEAKVVPQVDLNIR